MDRVFTLADGQRHDEAVEEWLAGEPAPLFAIARHWFNRFRDRGSDVRELLHDGCPTACVGEVAMGYVNVFKAHVNVGFYCGASLPDPHGLLQGSGRYMRHVKIAPGEELDAAALESLIDAAYEVACGVGRGG